CGRSSFRSRSDRFSDDDTVPPRDLCLCAGRPSGFVLRLSRICSGTNRARCAVRRRSPPSLKKEKVLMRKGSWVLGLAILGATVALVAQAQIPDAVGAWTGSTIHVFSGSNDGYLINGATLGAGKSGKGFLFDG